MALGLHRTTPTYAVCKPNRFGFSQSTIDLSREKPVSRLIILQARFQQKQLEEKEARLTQLYEEQQQRTLQRVGVNIDARTLGPGKVRTLLQSRRNPVAQTQTRHQGRDKSHPLQPIVDHGDSYSHHSDRRAHSYPVKHARTHSLDPNYKPPLYFGGSHQDLRFSDELDHGESFHVIDDQQLYRIQQQTKPFYQASSSGFDSDTDDDYIVRSFNNKRQFYEEKFGLPGDEVFHKLPNVGSSSIRMNQKPVQYKNFVSAAATSVAPKKPQTLVQTNRRKNNINSNGDESHDSSGSLSPLARPFPRQPIGNKVSSRWERSSSDSSDQNSSPLNGAFANKGTRQISNGVKVPARGGSSPVRKSSSEDSTACVSSQNAMARPVPASRTSVSRPASAPSSPGKPILQKNPTPKSGSGSNKIRQPARVAELPSCRICGRGFASDRLTIHEGICQKATVKKRKVFDPVKHRVQGTDAEKYVIANNRLNEKKTQPKSGVGTTTSNWRKKHEDFINSIRAAKEVQAHLKKGGKLSELPPPPTSDYSDYIQCPHCLRKFNQAAADRHIPKCATMRHNKPQNQVKSSLTFRKK